MAALNLFINTANGTLFAGLQNSATISSQTLQLFFGDTVQVNIYLFEPIPASVNPAGNFPYQIIPNTGLTIVLYIDDGTIAGTEAPLASCVNFAADPTNTFMQGTLSLNTAGLQAKIGTGISSNLYLTIGYLQGAGTTTVFKGPVNVGVGALNGPLVVPPQLTALSLQQALLLFLQVNPVPGQAYYLATPDGNVIALTAKDTNTGPQFDASPTGQVV